MDGCMDTWMAMGWNAFKQTTRYQVFFFKEQIVRSVHGQKEVRKHIVRDNNLRVDIRGHSVGTEGHNTSIDR